MAEKQNSEPKELPIRVRNKPQHIKEERVAEESRRTSDDDEYNTKRKRQNGEDTSRSPSVDTSSEDNKNKKRKSSEGQHPFQKAIDISKNRYLKISKDQLLEEAERTLQVKRSNPGKHEELFNEICDCAELLDLRKIRTKVMKASQGEAAKND